MKILYFLGSLFLTMVALSLTGCQMTEPFIQINLGPSVSGGSMRRPMPMRSPQMMLPPQQQMQRGGYPAAGGNGGYYSGYQQPYGQPYGYGQPSGYGSRQPYTSGNALMHHGQLIPLEALRDPYFMSRYPNGFMRGRSSCHRPPPPPRCDDRRRHRR